MIQNYSAMKTWIFTIFLLLLTNLSFSQKSVEIIPDEILIQLEQGAEYQLFIDKYLHSFTSLSFKSIVSKNLNLYLFEYNHEDANSKGILQKINKLPFVNIADFNFRLKFRDTTPNDPLYEEQWDMDRISAPEAWDITKGGLTIDNQEIVVAVIEGGDIDHADVQGNIWTNKDEIPDDGIDNDNNGYVDDYYGVNVMDSTDNQIKASHSTSVMGIIGAKGNNNLGVTGVNWNVKLMIVSNNLNFDKIIESYEYVYEKRKAYNDSNGMEGAFVVATNSSFGVDNAFPDSNSFFPMWCEMYNNLGSVGVLSAGATTNSKKDIDSAGDMPATCSSDYLIAVTNTDIDDELSAGFSSTYVDLAAPGKNSYTLKPDNGYGIFGGTSAATPHVAGSIGLLYSIPCKGLINQAKTHPAETALLIKKAILDGVDTLASLEGKTVTGGRLNLFNSLTLLQNEFGSTKGNLRISKIFPNPSAKGYIKIEYQTPEFREYRVNIYNAIGQLFYIETISEFCAEKVLNIETTDWPSGVYMITIGNSSDISSSKFTIIYPSF